jgi:hypothetical protein
VIDACTNLADPVWFPVQSYTLTNGTIFFADPQWATRPGCFYRIRSP